MNLLSRVDGIGGMLHTEYQVALTNDPEPFERLLDQIETNISRYREYRRKQDE